MGAALSSPQLDQYSFRPDVIFGKDRHDKGGSFMKISSSIG
jgi:hypothetical protein